LYNGFKQFASVYHLRAKALNLVLLHKLSDSPI